MPGAQNIIPRIEQRNAKFPIKSQLEALLLLLAFSWKEITQFVLFIWDNNQTCVSVPSTKHILISVPKYPGKPASSDGPGGGAELLQRIVNPGIPLNHPSTDKCLTRAVNATLSKD